jgi:hexosaminidase
MPCLHAGTAYPMLFRKKYRYFRRIKFIERLIPLGNHDLVLHAAAKWGHSLAILNLNRFNMKIFGTIIILIITTISQVHSQPDAVIPRPSMVQTKTGEFIIDEDCLLLYDHSNQEIARIAGFMNEYLVNRFHFQMKTSGNGRAVRIRLASLPGLGDEGYLLNVDQKCIDISANAPAGLFYGFQTLKQLFPLSSEPGRIAVPAVEIKDQPRFPWRGNLLDVARHFFPVSYLKEYIDILASFKLNVLQLHLTDDQGWRIEIKKYPELTEVSHWREETLRGHRSNSEEYDGRGYGGFYTQEQMRELVRYAAERYIKIIPEIEMPGHATAALAAFPGLGCTHGPYKVATTWGIFREVFCAGREESFEFLQNVIDEVLDIFPSEFIHIGGDEVPKDRWKKCPDCQVRIKKEGLKDEVELHGYFITRMDKYLTSKGRRLIGWDEILDGGLAPGATVMSWRGIEGGIKAARMGHDVVMSPSSHLYFDHYQSDDRSNEPLAIGGFSSLEKVYSYEPVPETLTAEEAKHILGAQGNLWTEYVPSPRHAEYMLLPRLLALSEVVWTVNGSRDFSDFERRVIINYEHLKRQGINFRDHRK